VSCAPKTALILKRKLWKESESGKNYCAAINPHFNSHFQFFTTFIIEMPVFYKSVTTNWSSDPSDGVYGKRTEVVVKNGKGYKINAQLNKRGKTKKQIKKQMSKQEIASVVKGQFIPGFWENCTHGSCKTMRLRNRK
jgi:hypothetical protein